jgi:hypothetical protein
MERARGAKRAADIRALLRKASFAPMLADSHAHIGQIK